MGLQWQNRFGASNLSYLLNGQTGFAMGGGGIKIGMRDPADSLVMLDVSNVRANIKEESSAIGTGVEPAPAGKARKDGEIAAGGYRVTIDGRSYDYIEPGRRVALGLSALNEYTNGLKPEGAPQF